MYKSNDHIKMLNIIRESKDVFDVEASDYETWSKRLKTSVESSLEIIDFKYYKNSNNILLTGNIKSLNDLTFNYSLDSMMGLDMTVDSLIINEKSLDVLYKLHGNYLNWKDDMNDKLDNVYNKYD